MEFEKDTSPVSDEERRLAETKKLTLKPVHEDVAPEDIADSQIAAQHLASPAIQNAPNDMEKSEKFVIPAKNRETQADTSAPHHAGSSAKIVAGIIVLLCIGVTAGMLFMTTR